MAETRAEHMRWCKQRALEYVDMGDLGSAVASMASDLRKHPETAALFTDLGPLIYLAIKDAAEGDATRVRNFIEGFAE